VWLHNKPKTKKQNRRQVLVQVRRGVGTCEFFLVSSTKPKNKEFLSDYETLAQKALQQLATFSLTPKFSINNFANPLPLTEPKDFIYLGLKLDLEMTIMPAMKHRCQKINWAYHTVSAIAYSLKHNDTPASLRAKRTRSLILYRKWQSCILSHATQNLKYLLSPTQVQQVQSVLTSSLQRTLHRFTVAQITMLELGIGESPHSFFGRTNN